MTFAPNAPIDLALKERIRLAYYDEGRSIVEVEGVAGVGRSTLYRWFHAWGWPLRKPMRSRPAGRRDMPVFGHDTSPAFAAGGVALRGAARWSLKQRLERLVEHRIAILEHEAMAGLPVDADANARALDLNARTLVTIERLGGEAEPCPTCSQEPPTRSLSELRDELYSHLRRVRAETRASRGVSPDDDDEQPDASVLVDEVGFRDNGATGH